MRKLLASNHLLGPSYSPSYIYPSCYGLYENHSIIRPMSTLPSLYFAQVSLFLLHRSIEKLTTRFLSSPGCRVCYTRRCGSLSVGSRKPQFGYRGWGSFRNRIFQSHIFSVQPCFGSVRTRLFLLCSQSYLILLRRILLADPTPPNNPILRITQNRRLFRGAILAGLILGISAATTTNSDGTSSTTTTSLHVASTVIFLVVTVLQAVQTIFLAGKPISGMLSLYKLVLTCPTDY